MITIRTFQDNGPYFAPTKGSYQVARLRDFVFHVRQAMEDREDLIAVWDDDQCIGGWHANNDVDMDEDGFMVPVGFWYDRVKPDSWELTWLSKKTA
jgi:hypothetical protein